MFRLLLSINIILFIFIFLVGNKPVFADIPNPTYDLLRCKSNELQIECSWSSPNFQITEDECVQYRNNPQYRLLTGTGNSFGGSSKFCYYASLPNIIIYHVRIVLSLFFLTLLLEIPVFFIAGFHTKESIFSVVLANAISVPVFYFVTSLLLYSVLIVPFLELLVIIFESLFLRHRLRNIKTHKIVVTTFIANIISAFIGSLIISYLIH